MGPGLLRKKEALEGFFPWPQFKKKLNSRSTDAEGERRGKTLNVILLQGWPGPRDCIQWQFVSAKASLLLFSFSRNHFLTCQALFQTAIRMETPEAFGRQGAYMYRIFVLDCILLCWSKYHLYALSIKSKTYTGCRGGVDSPWFHNFHTYFPAFFSLKPFRVILVVTGCGICAWRPLKATEGLKHQDRNRSKEHEGRIFFFLIIIKLYEICIIVWCFQCLWIDVSSMTIRPKNITIDNPWCLWCIIREAGHW